MGYYTKFKLSFEPKKDQKVAEFLEKSEEFAGMWGQWQEAKWYAHEEEVSELSKKFPHILFKLEGKGEEENDIWIKYFKDGKVHRCPGKTVITFPDYDESKLEEPHKFN